MERGLPGTPEQEPTKDESVKDYESMAKEAIERGIENSHANLMNEGDDDSFQQMITRSRVRHKRSK